MKLRIKFAKYGAMRFIGHLDVMRYFQKALRRAGIDIAYSGGYSPHQIMSFAAPLGVGLSSNGEYMDIEVNSAVSSEDIKIQLNAQMVPGMEIKSVTLLGDDAKNAMASVAAAEYSVSFKEGYEPPFLWAERLGAFYEKPSIPMLKQTKRSEAWLDLKPAIFSLEAVYGENGRPVIHMLVDASSSGNIKPALVVEAFLKEQGGALQENALHIIREDTYTNIGTDEQPVFIPLGEAGREF